MKCQQPITKYSFKKFEDEYTSDESIEIERVWRKNKQQEKTTCRNKVIIVVVIATFLIFLAIMLNSNIGKSQSQHHFLQYPDQNYLLVQTNVPHIQTLLDKNAKSYEANLIKNIGIVYPQLVAWTQGNVRPCSNVLLMPSEDTGVNVLAVVIGYYLQEKYAGKMDIWVKEKNYRALTEKNWAVGKGNFPERYPGVNFVNETKDLKKDYDLIFQQTSDYQPISQLTWRKLIVLRDDSANDEFLKKKFTGLSLYEISKGKLSEQIMGMQRNYGYSLSEYQTPKQAKTSIVLVGTQKVGELGMCAQRVDSLRERSEVRGLIEYFRNKSMVNSTIFYGLQQKEYLYLVKNSSTCTNVFTFLQVEQQQGIKTIQYLQQMGRLQQNYIITDGKSISNISELAKNDVLIILIEDEPRLSKIVQKYKSTSKIQVIDPQNNRGCYYPHQISGLGSPGGRRPYFVVVSALDK